MTLSVTHSLRHFLISARLLRDFRETFEWLLRDFWETFERLLRDFWEKETERDRKRQRQTRRNKLATQCQNFLALHLCSWTLDGVDVREEILAIASSSEWKSVWIELSRREDLSFESSSDQTRVTATNPIQENLSTLFFSQKVNWCDPGLKGWPAIKKAH